MSSAQIESEFQSIETTARTSSAAAIARFRNLPRDHQLLVLGRAFGTYDSSVFYEMLLRTTLAAEPKE